MHVTRPQLPLTGPISRADLQRLNDIVVTVEPADANAIEAQVEANNPDGISAPNFFQNPNFDIQNWTLGTAAGNCAVDVLTERAEGWWCRPGGAIVTYGRSATVPGQNKLSTSSAEITGASSVTTVDFGQDFPSYVATAMIRPLRFSGYIYNGTGAAFTLSVLAQVANSADDFSAVTSFANTAVQAIAPAQWTRIDFALDLTSAVFGVNGLRIFLQMPSGSMLTGAVRFAQMKLESGVKATSFIITSDFDERSAQNSRAIQCGAFSNTQVSAGAAEIVVRNSLGRDNWMLRNLVAVIASGTSGANGLDTGSIAANTWYSVYAIAGTAGRGGIISLDGTAPALPAGYSHFAFIGNVRTDGSSHFYQGYQYDRHVMVTPRNIWTGTTVPVSPTVTTVDLAAFVPPNAKSISVVVTTNSATNPFLKFYATSDLAYHLGWVGAIATASGSFPAWTFDMKLLVGTTIYAVGSGATFTMFITGYEL